MSFTVPGAVDLAGYDAVLRWIEGFVLQPHPELGRRGAVCPLVHAAIRQGTLVSRKGTLEQPSTLATVVAGVRAGVDDFRCNIWDGTNRTLYAMLVLFPQLTEVEALLLDKAHVILKDELVELGIMMAPMHPMCRGAATRNRQFLAFRAPIPMIAIRNMAFHDLLSLDQKRNWFLRYANEFGARYLRPERLDPLMVERYHTAVERFGEPSGRDAAT